jgi:hypothetical protein
MNVLALGNEARELAEELFVMPEIDTQPEKKKVYDAVLSYMNLQNVPFRKVDDVVSSWANALKQNGEFVLFVPSLEWAAVQILSPKPSPALILHLFGKQNKPADFHACAFTLLDLRVLLSRHGIAVTHASTGEYMIGEHACECHSLRGLKK